MRYQPKTKPFPHQAKASIRAAKARNFAIFFEPRLGKSKAALDYVGLLALKGEVNRVLILAPRIAIAVWEEQIEKHYPFSYHAEDFESEWSSKPTGFITRANPRVQFFLAGREETMRMSNGKRPKQKIVEMWKPDVIIVDESHEYKRPGGRGAQDLWRLVERLRKRDPMRRPYVVLLTGTPNPKGWVDLFSQFRIMDSSIFGTSAADFKSRYVRYGHGKLKWRVLGYERESELEKKVRANSVSVNAEDAGLANVQFFENLKVLLPEKAKRIYLELAEELIAEWEGGVISAANAGVKRLRLLQICGGYTTDGECIHRAKVEALKAYLSLLLEQGESVVVYSRFTPEVVAVTEAAADVGFRTFRVDGSTSRPDRGRAIASLAKPPSTPTALCFQHQAGSRAIELVGAAEVVYYTAPDGWVDYYQTLKRVQGPNQKRPVRYTHLVCPGTVEVNVIKGLQEREEGHAWLMKNPRRYLAGLV